MAVAAGLALFALGMADPALAQVTGGGDPFQKATTGARTIATNLSQLALAIGAIGVIACLMLGFFGKLNWRWVATGVGVSFGIAIVSGAINFFYQLGT